MISNIVLEKLEFYKVLNFISRYVITEKGKELVKNSKPFHQVFDAIQEGNRVTEAKEILIKAGSPPIEYLPDLTNDILLSKIEGTVLSSKKILQIYQLAVVSRLLFQFLNTNRTKDANLFHLASALIVNKVLEHTITQVINDNGEIKDSASKNLFQIRRDIRDKSDELKKVVNRLIKDFSEQNFTREEYLTLRDGRVVIPVKSEHKRHIRGFIHSESATGQTVYIEPEETLNLNNEIVSLYFAERREIEKILKELTARISNYADELRNSIDIIAHVDSIFAKANYSIEIIGNFPSIDFSSPIRIINAKHPILINKLGKNNTVPLSLNIDDQKVVIITGPNAGGKTVVIKTIGLLTLLVQSGIHVPINENSNFHFFEKVLVDIGDQQSIEDDLSTFSSHLSNTNEILLAADENSLVILDEIGTGTEPTSGAAIAAAILINLRNKNALTFATTHHGNLKLIANDELHFQNASMEFDSINIVPTYIFNQGLPGSSYAFEIAKRIGLSNDLLTLASSFINPEQNKIDKILVDIELKSQNLKEKLAKLETENIRLQGLSNLYQQKLQKLETEKNIILQKTKDEGEKFLAQANKNVEKVIKELKESNADKDTIKYARTVIAEIKETTNEIVKEVEVSSDFTLGIGDFVKIKNTTSTGKVVDVSNDGKIFFILVGKLKMQVKKEDLIPTKEKEEKKTDDYRDYSIQDLDYRIDIRGARPEEIEFDIVKFIDTAYTTSVNRVEILHGKGTGALKKTVRELLSNHDKVKNFYFAPVEYGGEGITIVELM